jgi:hypothetical protein
MRRPPFTCSQHSGKPMLYVTCVSQSHSMSMSNLVHRDANGGTRLEEGATERLWGVVESMAVLRSRREGGRDALLLTFRCTAMSAILASHGVLKWDLGSGASRLLAVNTVRPDHMTIVADLGRLHLAPEPARRDDSQPCCVSQGRKIVGAGVGRRGRLLRHQQPALL